MNMNHAYNAAAVCGGSPLSLLIDALLRTSETVHRLVREYALAGLLLLDGLLSGIMAMAGFIPNEGETFYGTMVLKNTTTDRGTNLELLLFTNAAPGETITEATLTEPSGTGYARIDLTDGSWSEGAAGVFSYAEQTFTGGAGGWTGSIQGYAIVTKGTTPRILAIEVDSVNAPFTMAEGDTYKVTPQITYKDSTD
jgi:hypothetical protein